MAFDFDTIIKYILGMIKLININHLYPVCGHPILSTLSRVRLYFDTELLTDCLAYPLQSVLRSASTFAVLGKLAGIECLSYNKYQQTED